MTPEADDHARPLLRVVRGDATPEEIAALVAVVSATGAARPAEPPKFSLWSRKSRSTRPMLRPGFGAWRGSVLPR